MSTEKLKDVSIEKEVVLMLKYKPFYGHFLQNFRRIITDEVPTLGVNITDKINLYINPDFYNSMSLEEKLGVLEHEILHIINRHCVRGRKTDQKIFNYACDIAINQYIEHYNSGQYKSTLPKNALFPKTFGLPEEKTAEEYYKLLIKNAKKLKIKCSGKNGSGNGEGELDDHSKWGEGNDSEDYQHQIVKNAIKKTIEKTNNYGNLPSNIQAEIRKALHHETVNWRSILQKFIYRATIVNNLPTRKKPNRRYGFYFDGNKVECKLDMLVALDTSGSISDSDLSLFFSEIEKIKALGMEILIVECDTRVGKTYKFKNIPKVVSGRGGTEFKPIFDYANSLRQKPNCIVYLTDLYANLNFKNPTNIPTLWAVTENGNDIKNIPFGVAVKLKNDMEKKND